MGAKPRRTPSSLRAAAAKRLTRRRSPKRSSASVSDKLEALKNLIPSSQNNNNNNNNEDEVMNNNVIKPEQLFQETADYIVLLKTQVFVLQKLVDFYGSSQQQQPHEDNPDAANANANAALA